jgi:uncharacterized membrane-anchored protein
MTATVRGMFPRALLAGAACLAILGGMLVGHAWPLWTGDMVLMEATGTVPRDPFRGQYVRLDLPASTLRVTTVGGPAAGDLEVTAVPVTPTGRWWKTWEDVRKGQRAVIYVQLARQDGLAVPVSVSRDPVEGALNLKGRIRSARETGILRVEYGLDAFYVPEATARSLAPLLHAGRALRVEVAIAASGRARVRDLTVDGTPLPR